MCLLGQRHMKRPSSFDLDLISDITTVLASVDAEGARLVGIGCDLVVNARVERSWQKFGVRWVEQFLSCSEVQEFCSSSPSAETAAVWFAAKEAVLKALPNGTPFFEFEEVILSQSHLEGAVGRIFQGSAIAHSTPRVRVACRMTTELTSAFAVAFE